VHESFDASYRDDPLYEFRPLVTPGDTGMLGALDRWRRRSATGALLTSVALGLRHVFDPEKKERIVVEQEAPGQPEKLEPLELHFDAESPHATFVVLRPWLARDPHA
jgi:hypothetical protein